MRKIIQFKAHAFWLPAIVLFSLGNIRAADSEEKVTQTESQNTSLKANTNETERQLYEYYGVEAGTTSERKYSTYFYTNGMRKLGATSEQLAEVANIQGKKCIAERKTTAVGDDPAATATIGFVLCVENSRLIRMSRKSKEIELAIPVESIKVEIKIYAESSAEDTYFLKFEKRKNIEINGKLYPEVIVREKKIFSDKSGKTLFAITKSYFVKKIGMVYEVSYLPNNLEKPTMATILNE